MLVVVVVVVVLDFLLDVNRDRLLLDDFLDDFLLFDDDWLVVVVDVLDFGVRVLVVVLLDGHVDHNLLFVVAERRRKARERERECLGAGAERGVLPSVG